MGNTIWITGANGFSGKNLINYIRSTSENAKLIGIGRSDAGVSSLDGYYKVDVRESTALDKLAHQERPDFVFHLAGLMPPHASESDMWQTNVGGSLNLLRAIHKAGLQHCKILITGSAAEYLKNSDGHFQEDSPSGGETAYGKTKWAQGILSLHLAKELKLSVIHARVFNLIGPGLSENYVASTICRQFADKNATELKIGNTSSERDFIDIRDCVAAYWALANKGTSGEIYNICSGTPTSVSNIIDMLREITDSDLPLSVDQQRLRSVDLDRAYGSNDKIQKATGWSPSISLKQSLRNMLVSFEARN